MNDQLDFILTVIKRDYNTNNWLKFIISFISRDNSLNDRLKLVKNERKENQKWTKWRWKQTKQEMNWKSRIQTLTGWRPKNGWRTVENLHGFTHGNISEILRKHLGLDFLHGNTFFSLKTIEMHSIGVRDPWNSASSPYL